MEIGQQIPVNMDSQVHIFVPENKKSLKGHCVVNDNAVEADITSTNDYNIYNAKKDVLRGMKCVKKVITKNSLQNKFG